MTGITRVSKEFMFSDLNNLKVVTVSSREYGESFIFMEREVFAALDEYAMADRKDEVKMWYDGFVFGNCTDIYNPWSIINFLDTGMARPYWVNTRSNSLAEKLVREMCLCTGERFGRGKAGKHGILLGQNGIGFLFAAYIVPKT